MRLEGSFDVNAPRALVWNRITDPTLMVGCIPGCEEIEQVDPTTYKAVVAVSVGVVKARFHMIVRVTKEEPPSKIHTTMTGEEGTQASRVTAVNVVTLAELDRNETRIGYVSDVSVSGRLGKYGLGIMRKRVAALSDEFAANFVAKLDNRVDGTIKSAEPTRESKGWSGVLHRLGFGRTPQRSRPTKAQTVVSGESDAVQTQALRASETFLRPKTVEDAVKMLTDREQAYPLSGGATLIAMKNAGLVDPSVFVSLEAIEELHGIAVRQDGSIRIGAMTRHRDIASSEILTGTLEMVRLAAQAIANPAVRNMGTIGGSVANADPAADYLPALICADARVELAGPAGRRNLDIGDFLVDWYATALVSGEIVTAIELPAPEPGYSTYRKVARVSGDYATASCAASVSSKQARCRIKIAIGGCGPYPIRDREAELKLSGSPTGEGNITEFTARLVKLADPVDDVRGSAEYRRLLIPRLVENALANLSVRKEIA